MRPSGRSASHTEPCPPLASTLSQALLIDVEVYDAADVQVYLHVKIGIFSPTRTNLLSWNNGATTITVQ